MRDFRTEILQALSRATGRPPASIVLETPRDRAMGDHAFPCFALAKERREPPPKVAASLAPLLSDLGPAIGLRATGPYLNFTVDRATLARELLPAIRSAGERWGGGQDGSGRCAVVDFSSPNIAKPLSVGHLRSTVIGAAVYRLLAHRGFRCVGINHLGDWGAQYGRMIAAFKLWGDPARLESDPIPHLHELYVRFHEEEGKDASGKLSAQARTWFKALESGEENEARALWRRLTDLSLREFDRIYSLLGVRFDFVRGESHYEKDLAPTIERLVAAGVTKRSEGALIVDLEDAGMPPCILQTAEGTTLYATRDLAAALQRKKEFDFWKALYVVGADQRLHFRQLREVLKRLGLPWAEDVVHVDFGLMQIRAEEGVEKMSTRRGKAVHLEELLRRSIDLVRGILREKNPDLADTEAVARAVGVGAVVFHDLKNARVKDVVFDWKEVLNFDGETGPYLQYTHARLCSILRKAPVAPDPAKTDFGLLADAGDLLPVLAEFPRAVAEAGDRYEPSILSTYLLDLAQRANGFYRDHRVIGEDEALMRARLLLVEGARATLRVGLGLLGVAAPEEM
ncbi:MAG: arginine--tRNA ligase [Planctomycetes bacterium]|nr:arginine--tRNA ligase [Planctomycetota bacterium]